jgi:hypothetical protein
LDIGCLELFALVVLPISASQIGRITGVNHQTQLCLLVIIVYLGIKVSFIYKTQET